MARPKDVARRDALLDAVVEAFAEGGIGARSLRDVADEVGTSHRMLLHHFGSREGLLLAVVEEVEARERRRLGELHGTTPEVAHTLWEELVAPELRPFERLFFECYARGAGGEAPFDTMHPASVHTWLADVEALGVDPVLARLGLAVVRGLLLDLVATGDVEATTAAFEHFEQLVAGEAT